MEEDEDEASGDDNERISLERHWFRFLPNESSMMVFFSSP